MSRKHDEPAVPRHLKVYEVDWDYLNEHYGRGITTRRVEAAVAKQRSALPEPPVTKPELLTLALAALTLIAALLFGAP